MARFGFPCPDEAHRFQGPLNLSSRRPSTVTPSSSTSCKRIREEKRSPFPEELGPRIVPDSQAAGKFPEREPG